MEVESYKMLPKIVDVYIAVFGSGLGHAVRMLELAVELRNRGKNVLFSSYGEPAEYIRREGFQCISMPPVDVNYSSSGALSPNATVISFPIILFSSLIQYSYELRNISRINPRVVVSDSLPTSVVAGIVCRKPVITFLNQASIEPSKELPAPLYRAISIGSYSGLTRVWNKSKHILIPDLPPPYTIGERNLRGLDSKKVIYTGFLLREDKEPPDSYALEFASQKKPKIFWSISGPQRTRASILKIALDLSIRLSEKYAFVISAGNPKGSSIPKKFSGIILYEWCPFQEFFLKNCDIAVSRAGHMTIGMIINHGKPAILIPIKNQTEQEGNAEKAVRLGFAVSIEQTELSYDRFRDALSKVLSGSYSEKAKQLSLISKKQDSFKKSLDVILGYC
jgi:UDP:flavonoid glycosyltransferase YjiC (YdhE family)